MACGLAMYIILRGPLGCGKTTIAKLLAKRLNAKVFDVDKAIEEIGYTWEKGYISQKSFIHTNALIAQRAKPFLQKGVPVIFEGNFYWRSQIADLKKRLKSPCCVFTLKVPLKECIARDAQRKKPLGEKAAREVYVKSFDAGRVIENKDIKECIKEILSYISKNRGLFAT